jgi:hypothetical protein
MHTNPKWWTDDTTNAWDRTKEAMKRDWEQTKHDLGGSGPDLDQDVDDTVKQAAGRQAIPPTTNTPNLDTWDRDEPAVRYGWGAAGHYKNQDWDDRTEGKLKEEWNDLKTGRTWDEIKSTVRRGWDKARGKARRAA